MILSTFFGILSVDMRNCFERNFFSVCGRSENNDGIHVARDSEARERRAPDFSFRVVYLSLHLPRSEGYPRVHTHIDEREFFAWCSGHECIRGQSAARWPAWSCRRVKQALCGWDLSCVCTGSECEPNCLIIGSECNLIV